MELAGFFNGLLNPETKPSLRKLVRRVGGVRVIMISYANIWVTIYV